MESKPNHRVAYPNLWSMYHDQARWTFIHELGHALVAFAHGVPVRSIEVMRPDRAKTHLGFQDVYNSLPLATWLHSYIEIGVAGALAEQMAIFAQVTPSIVIEELNLVYKY